MMERLNPLLSVIVPLILGASASAQSMCPKGSNSTGESPPKGIRQWCQRTLPNGKFQNHGPMVEWYKNGKKKAESFWSNGVLQGKLTTWFENGKVKAEAHWEQGQPSGTWSEWHENGKKSSQAEYKNGLQSGKTYRWDVFGTLVFEATFDKGRLIDRTTGAEPGS